MVRTSPQGRAGAEAPTTGSTGDLRAEPAGRHAGLFKSLFERSGMGIASLDLDLRVQEANADFYRQFGLRPSEAYGCGFTDLLHPSVAENLRRQLAKLAAGKRTRFCDHMVAVRGNGAAFSGELIGIMAHGQDGRPEAVIVLVKPENTGRDNPVVVERGKMLSELDARILEGVAAGVSTVQLANQLYLSRQGVEYHVSAMLRRLKAPNRPALVSRAYALGILGVGNWPPRVLPEYVK
ncbi:PAS domain-containing protein [Goodfellowiella coeruleoviolacea]|uniref:PAS domain-containing protein n=1 Tax=Goodfellowiella coeruleoviolacea TaxID=334858 RepID=UPI000A573847|nr:PAS domain-containing protein [Goodfellowiella coeruleoviolacea]